MEEVNRINAELTVVTVGTGRGSTRDVDGNWWIAGHVDRLNPPNRQR
jgi:hypothetical protein